MGKFIYSLRRYKNIINYLRVIIMTFAITFGVIPISVAANKTDAPINLLLLPDAEESTTDEQAIRNLFTTMKACIESRDQACFFALFAPDYIHDGIDLANYDVPDFSALKTFTFNISNIDISGDTAKVYGTITTVDFRNNLTNDI